MWTSGGVSTSDAVQVGRQQWRMARVQLSHRDALISSPVAWPAAVRMLHVGKCSVDTRVWIAVIPCGGDGVLMPMELPGEDRGGDPSPRPGMRERERERERESQKAWMRDAF